MTRVVLATIEHTALAWKPKSDEEVTLELANYLEDREAWQWKEEWSLTLVSKKDNVYTFVIEGEYNDEI